MAPQQARWQRLRGFACEAHGVAAGLFGLEHGQVCAVQRFGDGFTGPHAGNAGRDGELPVEARHSGQQGAQATSQRPGFVFVLAQQQHTKLFTAQSAEHVAVPQCHTFALSVSKPCADGSGFGQAQAEQ